MLKLILIFIITCVLGAAMAAPTDEHGLDARRAFLEEDILTRFAIVKPEDMHSYVVELKESIYKQLPLSATADRIDRWTRDLVNTLYDIGKISSENCHGLERYNKKVDKMIEENGHMENLVKFARFYQKKQVAMC